MSETSILKDTPLYLSSVFLIIKCSTEDPVVNKHPLPGSRCGKPELERGDTPFRVVKVYLSSFHLCHSKKGCEIPFLLFNLGQLIFIDFSLLYPVNYRPVAQKPPPVSWTVGDPGYIIPFFDNQGMSLWLGQ